MRIQKDQHFLQEFDRYNFTWSCERCVHFDLPGDHCSLLWPHGDHLEAAARNPSVDFLIFCKEFDLN
ncbi:hypothetical protein KKF84_22110 [Myxococcota bacterium]|nr:hypothetical protein [Myxococcota bacterium]MBU1538023.1 hypothetical protein [Myxococcota bacterium]